MLARRIEIAKRLLEGESYGQISSELRVGFDTIAKVQSWLISGFGGYEKAVKGFKRELAKRFSKISKVKAKKYAVPYSFDWLKQKYPLQFLLFNLISKTKNK